MNLQEKPEAIAITWSQQMLKEGFGSESEFREAFEKLNENDEATWLQKLNNKPKHDVVDCFIIIANKVAYKAKIVEYNMTGEPVRIRKPGAPMSFSRYQVIRWKHVVLTGPVVKAPKDIPFRGFQGFRYVPMFY